MTDLFGSLRTSGGAVVTLSPRPVRLSEVHRVDAPDDFGLYREPFVETVKSRQRVQHMVLRFLGLEALVSPNRIEIAALLDAIYREHPEYKAPGKPGSAKIH